MVRGFTRNIIIVFAGASLVSFFNLLCQLLIAHKLSAAEFAAFNSLLCIFMVVSSPLNTIQMAVAKYSAEFYAHNQIPKLKFFLSDLIKKTSILGIFTLLIFWIFSIHIINALKISSIASGYILAALTGLAWLLPVFLGSIQGLEQFFWLASSSVIGGVLKLILAFVLIILGYNIAGALGALLVSNLLSLVILYLPLREYICLRAANPIRNIKFTEIQDGISNGAKEDIRHKEIYLYFLPVAISYFCFTLLVNFDMLLVRYYFSAQKSGFYSLSQMVGKIFLFLPGAISIVMFPKVSGLNAQNLDTKVILKKSLLYAIFLCLIANIVYNIFPSFVLKVLTGKRVYESVILGRLFGLSMSFFSLLFILISYFLSIKDLRFIKYLFSFTLLEILEIVLFHNSLICVQIILCINAILLFFTHLLLVNFRSGIAAKAAKA